MPPEVQTNTGIQGAGQQDGGQENTGGQGNGQGQQGGGTPFVFDTWLASQDAATKTGIETHIQGLRNTVQATRGERDNLQRQLADVGKALGGKNPEEAKRLLDEMSGQLEAANGRADFYAEAGRPEIGCTDPELAYLAAQKADLIDKKGRVNWEALKQRHPGLFRASSVPRGYAGAGTGTISPAGKSMNDFIRAAAGRS